MKIDMLFCSFSLPSPISCPAMFPWHCLILQSTRSQHRQHYHTSYKTSIQCRAPSHSQLLNKARFFKMISYKLTVIREACMSLKRLYQVWVSLTADTNASSVVWAVGLDNRQKAVPVTLHISSPAVPFFLINFCPTTVAQWSKEKKETVTSQRERNCH